MVELSCARHLGYPCSVYNLQPKSVKSYKNETGNVPLSGCLSSKSLPKWMSLMKCALGGLWSQSSSIQSQQKDPNFLYDEFKTIPSRQSFQIHSFSVKTDKSNGSSTLRACFAMKSELILNWHRVPEIMRSVIVRLSPSLVIRERSVGAGAFPESVSSWVVVVVDA